MKLSTLVIQLAVCGQLTSGFSPLLQSTSRSGSISVSQRFRSTSRVFSSQWDEDDDETPVEKATSFEDAGVALQESEDKEKMDGMGNYDANPAYRAADIERFRAAIKERAESLGIEESKLSKDAIKAAEARAQQAALNRGEGGGQLGQMLDLTQISNTAPRGNKDDEDMLSFFDEPEDEMSEEEMKEADPTGQLSLQEWALYELKETSWPTPLAALKEVLVLVSVIAFTATLIVQWDSFLRTMYTDLGMIPRPEDIMQGSENIVLPEGWTNGMSEDDFMKYQDEVGKVASSAVSAASSAFPDL
mmetsp:Transcript_118688/g.332387  ORF Transcript_118688/g.332387 Transcript_118688/m.332387 type:complete len:303 (-) Transcript_118688:182-1090(-)